MDIQNYVNEIMELFCTFAKKSMGNYDFAFKNFGFRGKYFDIVFKEEFFLFCIKLCYLYLTLKIQQWPLDLLKYFDLKNELLFFIYQLFKKYLDSFFVFINIIYPDN